MLEPHVLATGKDQGIVSGEVVGACRGTEKHKRVVAPFICRSFLVGETEVAFFWETDVVPVF